MLETLRRDGVGAQIERVLPSRKTSLFIALLVLGLASLFLYLDKIGSGEWITVAMFVLTAYVVKRHATNKLSNGSESKE